MARGRRLRCLLPLLAWLLPACAAVESAPVPAPVPDLSWLVGCWLPDVDGGTTESGTTESGTVEIWAAADDGVMHGCSYSPGAGSGFYELLRIDLRGEWPVYVAQPMGRTPGTRFVLREVATHSACFANDAHDYPQRIHYWREGEVLHARIEGVVRGQQRSATWRWQRRAASPR